MNITLIAIFSVIVLLSIILLIVITSKKKNNEVDETPKYRFEGPANSNYLMYKERENKALNEILAIFPKFTKESLYLNINDLTKRIIQGQNNGYISQTAFQKFASDKTLISMRSMKYIDTVIINYENKYMSVAVIFENSNKELYQLLMKMNVQNGLLYLDSYNASFWFNNNL